MTNTKVLPIVSPLDFRLGEPDDLGLENSRFVFHDFEFLGGLGHLGLPALGCKDKKSG